MSNLFLSSRPWSFTISIVIVVLAATLAYKHPVLQKSPQFSLFNAVVCLLSVVLAHAGGNLSNSYYDYIYDLDKKGTSADRTFFDYGALPNQIILAMAFCYACAFAGNTYFIFILQDGTFVVITISLIFLSYFYTAGPLKLKYRGLGDVVIFLCFGPLLASWCYFTLTHTWSSSPVLHAVPLGLLADSILYINNQRDIIVDKKGGAITVPQLLSEQLSFVVFSSLFAGAYISLYFFLPFSLVLLVFGGTIYFVIQILVAFQAKKWDGLCEKAAQLNLIFSVLYCGSLLFV